MIPHTQHTQHTQLSLTVGFPLVIRADLFPLTPEKTNKRLFTKTKREEVRENLLEYPAKRPKTGIPLFLSRVFLGRKRHKNKLKQKQRKKTKERIIKKSVSLLFKKTLAKLIA